MDKTKLENKAMGTAPKTKAGPVKTSPAKPAPKPGKKKGC